MPKHVQVREYVRALVREAQPGTAAPSERELVHRFHVARMTVRQAMDALVAEGMLERIPGRGTFVAHPRRGVGRLRGFTEEMTARGLLAESQTLLARREQAGPGVARALEITEGDAVIHWKRLRRADGSPMCLEDAYLNEVLIPGFLQSGMPTSLYDALGQRGLRPDLGRGLGHRRPGHRRGGRAARGPRRQPGAAPLAPRAGPREGRRGLPDGLPRRPLHPVGAARPGELSRPSSATAVPDSSHTHTGSGPPRSGWMCSACTRCAAAAQAHRPPAAGVDDGVLHVLGDQPGDVHLALGPLLGPPPPRGHGVLQRRDRRRPSPAAGPRGRPARARGPRGTAGGPSRHCASRAHTRREVPPRLQWPHGPRRCSRSRYAARGDVAGADEGGADRLHLVGAGDRSPGARHRLLGVPRDRAAGVRAAAPQRRVDDHRRRADPAGRARRGLPRAAGRPGCRSASSTPTSRSTPRSAPTSPGSCPGVPWTFHRAIDAALDAERAWARVVDLPGLVAVRSAGSPQGLDVGYDDLLALATRAPRVARLLMPGGGLLGEHVPWFVRAGVRAFHLGPQVRPGGTVQGLRRRRPRPLVAAAARRRRRPGRRGAGAG